MINIDNKKVPQLLYLQNVIYSDNKFYISSKSVKDIDNIDLYLDNYIIYDDISINTTKIYNNPILITRSLQTYCFIHALIDTLFPIFWTIQDIKEYYKENRDIQLFIRNYEFKHWRRKYLPGIDTKKSTYYGVYKLLIETITNKNIIFEYLIKNDQTFLIEHCYIYILDDKYQRTIHNHYKYWPRKQTENEILYSDNIIKNKLQCFTSHIKNYFNISDNLDNNILVTKKKLVIINRKGQAKGRNLHDIADELNDICSKNNKYIYNGIIYLEDLNFKDQILVFKNNDIIISPHGAGLTHCIWFNNKIIIDIFFNKQNNVMFKRLNAIVGNEIIHISRENIINYMKNEFLQ